MFSHTLDILNFKNNTIIHDSQSSFQPYMKNFCGPDTSMWILNLEIKLSNLSVRKRRFLREFVRSCFKSLHFDVSDNMRPQFSNEERTWLALYILLSSRKVLYHIGYWKYHKKMGFWHKRPRNNADLRITLFFWGTLYVLYN